MSVVSVVLTGNVSPLTAALARGASQLDAFGGRAGRLGAQAQAAATQANRLGSQAEAASARVARLGSQADAAAASAARLRQEAAQGGEGAARLARQAEAAAARAERLRTQAAGAASDVSRLGAEARRAAAEAEVLGAAAQRAAQRAQLMRAGLAAAATGGVLLAAGLAASIASAIDFEARMRAVASIDQDVRANFAETSSQILDMSKHMSQSAATLADGFYDIAGSGFYGADAMNILEVSARAATAGMTDTATSSAAVVAILNAYGLGAESAARASDALFATVNYGVISYEALTGAMSHVVGSAAQAGISIEEVGAALATMTRSGISASEAGVSLNNLIAKLVNPSKALSKVFAELGINIGEDLRNPAIGLHGVMMKLMDVNGGNLALTKRWIPEIRAARGALALWAADGSIYNEVFSQMGDAQLAAGSTMDAYGQVALSTKEKLAVLRNQVVSTGIEIGTVFLPHVTKAVEGISNFGSRAKAAATEVGSAVAPGFQAWAEAGRNVVDALDDLNVAELAGLAAKIGVGALVAGFNLLGTAVSGATGFLSDHTVAVHALVAAWLVFNAAAIARGIQLIAVTIASALVGGVAAAIAGVDALIARLVALGGGSVWRGLLIGTASIAAITAGFLLVTNEINKTRKAAEQLKALDFRLAEVLGSVKGTDLESFQKARDALAGMRAEAQANYDSLKKIKDADFWEADFWKGAAQFWRNYGKEADQAEEALNRVIAAQSAFTAKSDYMQANISILANQFGLARGAVEQMARTAGIDLTGALDAATLSGGTLREQFAQLVPGTISAATGTSQFDQAMKSLSADMDVAKKALQLLADSFDRLHGVIINAEISAAQWRIKMLELASGSTLAADAAGKHTTSLSESTVAGNQNRIMLLELANSMNDIASDEYRRVFAATNDAAAATTAYNETMTRMQAELEAAARKAGFTEEQVRALISELNLVPQTVSTEVLTPGLDKAKEGVQAYRGILSGIPSNIYTKITTDQVIRNYEQLLPVPGMGMSLYSRAAGGPITGPGGPTDDDILIAASSGEWVIRAAAAAKYGPQAMAAVNEGRALVVPRFATGGQVGGPRATTGGGRRGSAGTTGEGDHAVRLAARGAGTLAEVYQQAAAGVNRASAALRGVVPRMWAAERRTTYLGAQTGATDWAMDRWVDTLAATSARAGLATAATALLSGAAKVNTLAHQGNTRGLAVLGEQMGAMLANQYPGMLLAAQTQTAAQDQNTLANTGNFDGLTLLGTQMDTMVATQYPAVLLGTQTQTLAQGEGTLANEENLLGLQLLGTQMDMASGVVLPTLTAATDTQTVATDLHTAATDATTAALTLATAASTQTTAALGVQATASAAAASAADTATAASTTLTGALGSVTSAASAAAAEVDAYVAALNSIPATKNTTITTTYVTVGTPAAGAAAPGFARGGQVAGPGTGTSDSVLAALSAGEWVIQAAAAARQGPYRMAALNAGRADIVPRYARGGVVPGYARGGMVVPANPRQVVVGPVVRNNITFETSVTVHGGASPADAAAVRREVEAALAGVAERVQAGVGGR